MTTITATPNPDTGAVDLTISQTSVVDRVLRDNYYGVTELRSADGQFPTAASGTTVLSDYECANGTNTYSAVDSSGNQLATATVTVEIDQPWLLVPIAPNYSELAESVTNYTSGRSTNSTVHQIIGRSDPIVIMGKLGTRTGTLEVWASSISDAERLVRVFDRGEAVLLKQGVDGMDMYFIPQSLAVEPRAVDSPTTTMYKLTLTYTEVARPYGSLAGALGWTYAALASAWTSYDVLPSHYATYDDLTLDSRT